MGQLCFEAAAKVGAQATAGPGAPSPTAHLCLCQERGIPRSEEGPRGWHLALAVTCADLRGLGQALFPPPSPFPSFLPSFISSPSLPSLPCLLFLFSPFLPLVLFSIPPVFLPPLLAQPSVALAIGKGERGEGAEPLGQAFSLALAGPQEQMSLPSLP